MMGRIQGRGRGQISYVRMYVYTCVGLSRVLSASKRTTAMAKCLQEVSAECTACVHVMCTCACMCLFVFMHVCM